MNPSPAPRALPTVLVISAEEHRPLAVACARRGFAVEVAASTDAAVARLGERRFDRILLCLMRPLADGLAVLDALPASWNAGTPVLAVVSGEQFELEDRLARYKVWKRAAMQEVSPSQLADALTEGLDLRTYPR